MTMNTPNYNNPATPQVTATTPQEILCTSPIGPELGDRQARYVYLITYSQADTERFPSSINLCPSCRECICKLQSPVSLLGMLQRKPPTNWWGPLSPGHSTSTAKSLEVHKKTIKPGLQYNCAFSCKTCRLYVCISLCY